MTDIAGAFTHVVTTLEALEIPYVIVGSVAAASWGVIRATRDLDLAMTIGGASPTELVESLGSTGLYLPREAAITALRTSGSFNVLDPATGSKVDIFVCRLDDRFEQMRLERRVRLGVLGVDAWVASAEDLVLAKLRWRAETGSEVQWRDCVEIAMVNDLDVAHMHTWAELLDIADDLEALLATAAQ
jgi:hypothetical protein